MKFINCIIKGVVPLLQHKMTLATEAQLDSKLKKMEGGRGEENPEDYLYKVDGVIVQPAEHIVQAILKKIGNYRIQGRGKKSYKELGVGSIVIEPEFIKHQNQKWEVDVRTVVVPATRGRSIRKRPRFNDWRLSFVIKIMNDDLPVEILKSALDDAGRETGIGDYRPRFGRFIVEKFSETK